MISIDNYKGKQRIIVGNEYIACNFSEIIKNHVKHVKSALEQIYSIRIQGCEIGCFDFLSLFPNLKQIYFLSCKSNVWNNLRELIKIESLGLHNLKQGKQYLADTSFLNRFPNLEYLYVNMLGVNHYPELRNLRKLKYICGVFRNENRICDIFDFSSFEFIPNLQYFDGYMAVDRHKISAESFIPIIQNSSIQYFCYTQMFPTEDKKLIKLIDQIHPSIQFLPFDEKMQLRGGKFC